MQKKVSKLHITLLGNPITKKNSQQIIVNNNTGRPFIIPSKAYKKYAKGCKWLKNECQFKIDYPVNVKCIYYMQRKNIVDLVNLLEATCDILVENNVLADDNSRIVVSHDGSRVYYDKENARAEIYIEEIKK